MTLHLKQDVLRRLSLPRLGTALIDAGKQPGVRGLLVCACKQFFLQFRLLCRRQTFLPQRDALVFPQQRHGRLAEHPVHCVADVLKEVVEMLPGHAAGLHDLRHRKRRKSQKWR